MSIKAIAGRIEAYNIEEFIQANTLFDVIHRQMSPGKFHAWSEFIQVNGIILYRERWSHLTMVTGATPEGYFLFGGISVPGRNVGWCGGELSRQCLAYAPSSTEIDLIIPDGSDHCVLLVPKDLLLQHLDEETREVMLAHRYHIDCNQESGDMLIGLIQHLINKYPANCSLLDEERVCKAIEAQLLEAITQFLSPENSRIYCKSPAKRRQAFSRAIEYAESLDQPITVPKFAAVVGVSQRTLEMAFHEILDITPLQYLHWQRLDIAHRDLINADPSTSSVTEIAESWDYSELGRFAVEYKKLFSESPSTTLNAAKRPVSSAFLDKLL